MGTKSKTGSSARSRPSLASQIDNPALTGLVPSAA